MFMVPATIGVYASFNFPTYPILFGGYNMMFSFTLLVGHVAAICSDRNLNDGIYGKQHPVIYAVGVCIGILGFTYGFMTINQYKTINSVKCAILMRDILFSVNVAFGIADS